MRTAILLTILLTIPLTSHSQSKRPTKKSVGQTKGTKRAELPHVFEPMEENVYETRDADGWRLAAYTDNIGVYYQKERITEPAPNLKRVWLKSVRRDKTEFMLILEEYLCTSRESRVVSLTSYNSSGDVLSSGQDEHSKWGYIRPDSFGEEMFGIFCEGKDSVADTRELMRDTGLILGAAAEKKKDYQTALKNYQSALRSDHRSKEAREGVERVQAILSKQH